MLCSVVFSYWTMTLDLIESLFRKHSISYTRIDGSHSAEKREETINKYQTDESVQVILVSITCGGAGYVMNSRFRHLLTFISLSQWYSLITFHRLDLTAASVAYLLEPQWNPQMEEQALSRIHRLGQKKEVKTIRYRIRGSFEEVSVEYSFALQLFIGYISLSKSVLTYSIASCADAISQERDRG
jgi:SWI/SNF-related matrix-associated actin-dependent regulator of chromatin subfamily A3